MNGYRQLVQCRRFVLHISQYRWHHLILSGVHCSRNLFLVKSLINWHLYKLYLFGMEYSRTVQTKRNVLVYGYADIAMVEVISACKVHDPVAELFLLLIMGYLETNPRTHNTMFQEGTAEPQGPQCRALLSSTAPLHAPQCLSGSPNQMRLPFKLK